MLQNSQCCTIPCYLRFTLIFFLEVKLDNFLTRESSKSSLCSWCWSFGSNILVSSSQADADDRRVTGVFVILAHVWRYNYLCRFLLSMDVIALVYSLAVLVWVIICLVSGNSQFGGTGSLAAYITCILDQVSRSAPWIDYIYNFRCLFADDHSLGRTPVGTMEKNSEIIYSLLQISHAQKTESLSSNLSFLGLNMATKRPHSKGWTYQCGVLVDPRHDHALWGYMSKVELHYVLKERKLFLSTGSKAPVCFPCNFCL
jgi:hypothetical protein